jgi:hypothetical protein
MEQPWELHRTLIDLSKNIGLLLGYAEGQRQATAMLGAQQSEMRDDIREAFRQIHTVHRKVERRPNGSSMSATERRIKWCLIIMLSVLPPLLTAMSSDRPELRPLSEALSQIRLR